MQGFLTFYMGMETEGSNIHTFLEGDGSKGLDDLRCLDNGDLLTVYDKEDTAKVVWEGLINLIPDPNYLSVENYLNHHTYQMQQGVDIKLWNTWFANSHPASLTKKNL